MASSLDSFESAAPQRPLGIVRQTFNSTLPNQRCGADFFVPFGPEAPFDAPLEWLRSVATAAWVVACLAAILAAPASTPWHAKTMMAGLQTQMDTLICGYLADASLVE